MSYEFAKVKKRKHGYSPEQVDAFVEMARQQYEHPEGHLLGAERIRETEFDLVRGGYEVSAVDAALDRIEDALARMVNRISGYVDNQLGFIAQLRSRPILTNPYAFIDDKTADLSRAVGDLRSEIDRTIERAVALLEADRGVLRSLSPQGILDRGYSVLRDENGHVITDASKVKKDQKLRVRLAKGELGVTAND